jgi:hypothetical protein
MIRNLTLGIALMACTLLQAQTYFYIDQIAVVPANPTTSDNVSIQLIGDLSDTGAYIEVADAGVGGNTVHVTLVAYSNGGLTVLVPHTETLQLGQLPAGTYTIDFSDASTGIWDMAPQEQHTFTVTGDGGDPCDELDIVSVLWHPFTDTALVVHVRNNSTTLFDYPNFILLDDANDTLAFETVNFFGIGSESWHVMPLRDGVELPNVPFNARLELWTFFTSELGCAWDSIFDLCPPLPCTTINPMLQNMGGGNANGVYSYNINDLEGNSVASGQWTLTDDVQMVVDSLCLAPGNYAMTVYPQQQPTEGNPIFTVLVPGWMSGPSNMAYTIIPNTIFLSFYGQCIDGINAVVEKPAPMLHTAPTAGGLHVWTTDNDPLGQVWLFDAQGRLLFSTKATTDRLFVPIAKPGVYLLRAGKRTMRVLGGVE